jgi:hypothetical protein
MSCIAFHVRLKFFLPEGQPRLGHIRELAVKMPMPETTVDKDGGAPLRKDYVWRPWKQREVEPKSQAEPVQHGPDKSFRPCIPRTDPPHVPAPLIWG